MKRNKISKTVLKTMSVIDSEIADEKLGLSSEVQLDNLYGGFKKTNRQQATKVSRSKPKYHNRHEHFEPIY